jgi:hypothetical protein
MEISKILLILLELSISFYCLFLGWHTLRTGKLDYDFVSRINLWLVRKIEGADKEIYIRKRLTSPRRLRIINGYAGIIAGIILLIVTILTFIQK